MRLLLAILACTALAYALAFTLAVPANPEVKFWRAVDELRDREIAAVREERPDQPIIFFTGGSALRASCLAKALHSWIETLRQSFHFIEPTPVKVLPVVV